MTTTPLVDILMPTYNHQNFLTQAIESVLAQKTDFEYRLNIGDDCSTDGTQAIIREYQQKYPDRIRAIISPVNVGISHKDRVVIKVLNLCTAKYIAFLEGDDYWTHSDKLQKQVDFLESHPDFAICCHNVKVVYDDRSKEPANLLPPNQPAESTLEDLLMAHDIPTCSNMFRRGLFGELPEWFFTLKLGDWPMNILTARHGKIAYLNEVMAAYRVHQGGLWSGLGPLNQGLEIVKMLDYLDPHLGFRYKKIIRKAKAAWYFRLAETSLLSGDRIKAREFMRNHLSLNGVRIKKEALSLLLRMEMPALYRNLISLRNLVRPSAAEHPEVN